MTVKLPDAEDLGTDQLTDEQRSAVEAEKEQDWDAEDSDKDKKSDKEDVTDDDKEDTSDKKEDKKEDDEASKKADEEKKAEEEAEAAENERLEKKAKELDKSVDDVKEIETQEKAEQERVEKVAKDEGITIEEVKENEDKDKAIADRHGSDPVKLARALRKEQSEYGKIKQEAESLREYKTQHETHIAKIDEVALNSKFEEDRDKIVDMYREKYPDDSEDASDDAIFERAKAKIVKGLEQKQENLTKEFKTQADEKRKSCVTDLSDDYKEYLPEVRKMLKECTDSQVLDKEFSVEDVALFARGKKFTPDYIKSLEDAAYKRGSERAKIIPKIPGGKSTSKKTDAAVSGASTEDRERALEIYSKRTDMTDSQKISEYLKNDKKDDF